MQTGSDANVQFQKCDCWVGKKLKILHISHAQQYLKSQWVHFYSPTTMLIGLTGTGLKLLDKQKFIFSLKGKKSQKSTLRNKLVLSAAQEKDRSAHVLGIYIALS